MSGLGPERAAVLGRMLRCKRLLAMSGVQLTTAAELALEELAIGCYCDGRKKGPVVPPPIPPAARKPKRAAIFDDPSERKTPIVKQRWKP